MRSSRPRRKSAATSTIGRIRTDCAISMSATIAAGSGPKDFLCLRPSWVGRESVPRYSALLGLVGLHLGILGLIIAAGSSDAARQSGNAIGFASFVWLIGVIFVAGAFVEEARTK